MPKSTTLSLVGDEEEPQVVESTAEVVGDETPVAVEEVSQEPSLEERLALAEARLARLEQMAHTEHTMMLGDTEIAAIAEALKPYNKQYLADILRTHLGIAPPPIRGDEV